MGSVRQKQLVWFGLVVLGMILYALKLECFFGITISLVTVVCVIMIRLFPTPILIATNCLIYLMGCIFFKGNPIDLLFIIEMTYLALVYKRDKEANLVNADMIFWIVFGGVAYYLIQQHIYVDASNKYILMVTYIHMLNSIVCVLMADLLIHYLPWQKWFRAQQQKHYYFKLKYFLFHIFMSIVSVAFIFNMYTNAQSYQKSTTDAIQMVGDRIRGTITRELRMWEKKDIKKLSSFGVGEIEKFGNLLNNNTTNMDFQYVITNLKEQVIMSSDQMILKKQIFKIQDNEKAYRITTHIQKVTPMSEENPYHKNVNKQYFLYGDSLEDYGIKIYLKMPIMQYQERVIRDYTGQLKLLGIIYMFVSGLCFVMNRLVFKPLEFLVYTTRDIPKNINYKEEIIWPNCYVYEVGTLIQNFRITAQKLNEMFQQTNALNQELSAQSEKLKESKERLHQLAYYDPLTQIGNRLSFKKYIDKIKLGKVSDGSVIAVIFMDMDHFKQINDTLGHDAGDELLRLISNRLELIKRIGINVFRLGGDEFVVTVNTQDVGLIYDTGDAILKVFEDPFMIGDNPLIMKGSIGVSVYPLDSEDLDTVVKYADMAMYECKNQGGGYVQFFNQKIKKCFEEQVIIEQNMREALLNGDFEMYYQPKINFKKNKVTSMEALIRWKHKEFGYITPGEFIPIAEETGFIIEIDRWTIREVCRQNKAWQDMGYEKIPISINISAKHFSQLHFLGLIKQVLKETELSPKYVIIEITEGSALGNEEYVIETIKKLKDLGIKVSIDDFGRGYSSINQLLTLPISEIKIDKDFVHEIRGDQKKEIVVKMLIYLAHELELNVVAEGIETEVELGYLLEMDCDEIQGYLISRPLPVEKVVRFISKNYNIYEDQVINE